MRASGALAPLCLMLAVTACKPVILGDNLETDAKATTQPSAEPAVTSDQAGTETPTPTPTSTSTPTPTPIPTPTPTPTPTPVPLSMSVQGFFGLSELGVQSSSRALSMSGLSAGRQYSFLVKEAGVTAVDLSCSSLPVYAKVQSGVLVVDFGLRHSSGTEQFNCTTAGGALTIALGYEQADIAVVSSSMELSENGGFVVNGTPSLSADGDWIALAVYGAALGGSQIVAKQRSTGKYLLVSSIDGVVPGYGDSSVPQISGDGRYVLFASKAGNLVADGDTSSTITYPQFYRKDLLHIDRAPDLVSSLDGTYANKSAGYPMDATMSADGRWIAFDGAGGCAYGNTSNFGPCHMINVKDMDNPTNTPLFAHSVDGSTVPNEGIDKFVISGNGRYVFFTSYATDLVASVNAHQLLRKDLQNLSNPPVLVSSVDGTAANQANTVINAFATSADGRYVVFLTSATNLASGVTGTQLWLKDMNQLSTAPVLVSSTDGTVANRASGSPSAPIVSADGQYVYFVTSSANLVGGSTSFPQVVRKDITNITSAPVLITSKDGTTANMSNGFLNGSYAMSSDGKAIAFVTSATNLVADMRGMLAVFGLRGTSGTTFERVLDFGSIGAHALDASASAGGVSDDGRYVLFWTASRLVLSNGGSLPANTTQVYLRDLQNIAAPPLLVSSLDGTVAGAANKSITSATMSRDGRWVAFITAATNFGANSNVSQVFVKDASNPATAPVLVSSADQTAANQAGTSVSAAAISGDGTHVVFATSATNLVSGTSGTQIYVKNLNTLSAAPALVTSTDGTGANCGMSSSSSPAISYSGRYVVFASASTNFGATSGQTLAFRKDLQSMGTAPVVVSTTDGTSGGNVQIAYTTLSLSDDGRYVAFSSSSSAIAGLSSTQYYVKDMNNPGTYPVFVSTKDGTTAGAEPFLSSPGNVRISGDGHYVFYASQYDNPNLTYEHLYRKDLTHLSNSIELVGIGPILSRWGNAGSTGVFQVSSDGRYVVITASDTNFIPGIGGGTSQVFYRDLQ